MQREGMEAAIRQQFLGLRPTLDERGRRLWASSEAQALGYGGITLVARATGVSRRATYFEALSPVPAAMTPTDA